MPHNHGVRAAYVLQNVGTESFVTHTESSFGVVPVCLIWDDLKAAKQHAENLRIEYQIAKPSLPVTHRTWRVRRATRDQLMLSLAAGAYGPEYTHTINSETSRIGGRGTTDDEAEAFGKGL